MTRIAGIVRSVGLNTERFGMVPLAAAVFFFGGALALAWTFVPPLFPWLVGASIAALVFTKADNK